jgi:hypothetical protein
MFRYFDPIPDPYLSKKFKAKNHVFRHSFLIRFISELKIHNKLVKTCKMVDESGYTIQNEAI